MAEAVNTNPTPATPSTISPKVTAGALTGLALGVLSTLLLSLAPEHFEALGIWAGPIQAAVVLIGTTVGAWAKSDPARLVTGLFDDGYEGKHVAR